MNAERVRSIVAGIESALADLKQELGAQGSPVLAQKNSKLKAHQRTRKRGSTAPVDALIAAGFFQKPKTDLDVVDALKKKALKFKRTDIAVTLMRFVRKETLQREGEGTKASPWRYTGS